MSRRSLALLISGIYYISGASACVAVFGNPDCGGIVQKIYICKFRQPLTQVLNSLLHGVGGRVRKVATRRDRSAAEYCEIALCRDLISG